METLFYNYLEVFLNEEGDLEFKLNDIEIVDIPDFS